MLPHRVVISVLAALIAGSSATAGINIGQGPVIGTDSAGNSYHQEFQDWTHSDCKALDGAGATVGGRYNFNDGFDDSRDLVAFYFRDEPPNCFFRVDLYDLKLGAENGFLDIYVAIDTNPAGGAEWMPDFTDVKVDPAHRWEVCIALYDSSNRNVYNSSYANIPGAYVGAYFNSQLDAVEFAITRQTLLNNGWDGVRPLYFTVMTTKDNVGGAGEINGGGGACSSPGVTSDATDTFFDDDRGFLDCTINGAIASTSTVGRAKFASIAHGNQSINKNDDTRIHIFDPNVPQKTGFIRALDTHQIFNVPLNIHMSGSLIVAAKWAKAGPGDHPLSDGPAFLQRVGEFVNADQNDGRPGSLIGGVYAEHIMPYFEGAVNAKSIQQFDELTAVLYGQTGVDMKVMHTPERVIRSYPTGLSPLDGLTFADIAGSTYTATYIDEVTHLHWWFYPNDPWSGFNGTFTAPRLHKIHRINGVYCFAINDRVDQQKFGNFDSGLPLDARFVLIDKANHPDQAQLVLIFDDWEAMAGKSFDPGQGQSVPNNNQIQYQTNIRWIANHPWIEVVNLRDVLDRAVNAGNPLHDPAWVIDMGTRTDLSIQTYEWLKHASEDSYHNWYYNSNAGFPGNEQNFYNLVPVLLGEQGDYHRRFPGLGVNNDAWADSLDGPKLPSGKRLGDLNTPGTLLHDTWALIAAAPAGRLKDLAEKSYSSLIYETAWHEEDYGATHHYQGTNYGTPWPVPDPTWDGVNTWCLRLQNHVRSLGVLAHAAQWAENVRAGTQNGLTTVAALDLDQDGQNEWIILNNRIYVCFERWGGRLVHGFAFIDALDDAVQVLGAPLVNPSEPGEEERLGTAANRCSTFKDANPAYVDAEYGVAVVPNGLQLTSPDGRISKTVTVGPGSGVLAASYANTTGANLYVRIGASPNVSDLALHGQDHLSTSLTGSDYTVSNSQGGRVRVVFGASSLNPTPANAGYLNRNLALTEQIEVFGGASFSFDVDINNRRCGPLKGDFDWNCLVNLVDVPHMVAALLGTPLSPGDVPIADMNGDGIVDGRDIQLFVNAM